MNCARRKIPQKWTSIAERDLGGKSSSLGAIRILTRGETVSDALVKFVLAVIAIGYVGFYAYIFFFRPEHWAEMQRRKHEKALADAEERKAKARQAAGNLLGGVAKVVIEALKHKR